MKRFLTICLVIALFAAVGCGNKPQTDDSKDKAAGAAVNVSLTDPVDGSRVEDFENAKYSYVYNGTEYRFSNKDNYEAFKKDPAKYVKD